MDKFWLEMGCKCPKMDNENAYPHRSYRSQTCPLHRLKECEKCGTTENVTYWNYSSYDLWDWNDDWDSYGSYYCNKCGSRPYIVVIGTISISLVIFVLVQLFVS